MNTKYGFDIKDKIVTKNNSRLINQIWKLIPMKENNEDWQSHLKTIIEEVCGLDEIFREQLDYLILLSKLEGLQSSICEDFMVYRKTVFRCIDLLAKVNDYDEP